MKTAIILAWLNRTKPLTTVASGPGSPIHRLSGGLLEDKR